MAHRGIDVRVTLGQPADALASVPAHQFEILERMGVSVAVEPGQADVVVDALIGYSLKGAPRGRVGDLVASIGEIGRSVVALDTPSGLNVTDGSVPGSVVRADATMTLALPKIGLRKALEVGELYVADISVPPSVFDAVGVGPPPDFTHGSIIRLVEMPDTLVAE